MASSAWPISSHQPSTTYQTDSTHSSNDSFGGLPLTATELMWDLRGVNIMSTKWHQCSSSTRVVRSPTCLIFRRLTTSGLDDTSTGQSSTRCGFQQGLPMSLRQDDHLRSLLPSSTPCRGKIPVKMTKVLDINSSDTVLTLTSGGCNALDLALQGAGLVVGVDINPAQSYPLELKRVAVIRLPFEDVWKIGIQG